MSIAQTATTKQDVAFVTINAYSNPVDKNVIEVDIRRMSGDHRYQNVWQWVERKRTGLCDGYSNERFVTAGAAACAAMRIAEADGVPVSSQVQAAMRREQLAGWELRFFGHEETACRNELQLDGYKQRIHEELQEAIAPRGLPEAVIEEKEEKRGLDATEWPPEDEDEYGHVTYNAYGDEVYPLR